MVHVNSVTSKLTDLVSKIDELQKIITLESNNQLEIAEIRKNESADTTGDYQKYIAGLDMMNILLVINMTLTCKIRSNTPIKKACLVENPLTNHKDKSS